MGDLAKSVGFDRSLGERMAVGVPAFEADLVGESDLARPEDTSQLLDFFPPATG